MPKAVALPLLLLAGCLWDRSAGDRLARLQMGANARRLDMPAPQQKSYATTAGAATTTEMSPDSEAMSGVTGSMQWTIRQTKNIYAGGEIEAGPFQRPGSYFGAAYGVLGFEARSGGGSLSVEMIGGRQWLRYGAGVDDVPVNVLEPRARGQLALSDQVSLGAVLGAGLGNDAGFMGGIYIGVYSEPTGGKQK